MEIYADLLFLENVTINYILLRFTQKVARVNTGQLRLLMGAIVGALGVFVYLFFPHMGLMMAIVFKIGLSIGIILVSFQISRIKQMISLLTGFYLSSFVLAGVVFAFIYSKPVIGEELYYSLRMGEGRRLLTLILSAIAVFILLYTFWGVYRARLVIDSMLIPLEIGVDEKVVKVDAFMDTGNLLCDPITNAPVIVVELDAMQELMPKDMYPLFASSDPSSWDACFQLHNESTWKFRIRMIPFQSLGNQNGMLLGFKPDFVIINHRREEGDIVIAIYDKPLSKGGDDITYHAIVGPQLI